MTTPQHDAHPRAFGLLLALLAGKGCEGSDVLCRMTDRDWQEFVDLATDRHKVVPLITQALPASQLPEGIAETLDARTQQNAFSVLNQVACTRSILDAMSDAGLEPTVLKGWPLSEDLFGSSSLRQARDIDLILPSSDVRKAAGTLQDLGYDASRDHPELMRALGTDALTAERNNLSFTHALSGLLVELHWRCHQFSGWPELFGQPENTRLQQTSAGPVRVPTEQANLLYLSVHGSLHRWGRLKWLCDIAALAQRRGVAQLEHDLTFARKLGAERPLSLALTLAGRLLEAPCPADLLECETWLERKCIEEILRPEPVPASLAHRAKFYAMTLALAQGTQQRLGILRYRLWGKNRLGLQNLWKSA